MQWRLMTIHFSVLLNIVKIHFSKLGQQVIFKILYINELYLKNIDLTKIVGTPQSLDSRAHPQFSI